MPVVGCALEFSPDNEKATYQMEYYFRKYTEDKDSPGIMKLWLGPKPIVIVYKPETAKIVLESNDLISKPFEYSLLQDWLGTGLLTSTGEKWHKRRKILTPAFHFKILQNFIQVFNRQSNTLVEILDEFVHRGYPFDFYKCIKLYALDIICEAAMGIQMNSQKGKNAKYVEAVKKMCEISFYRMRSPWLWPEIFWRISTSGKEFKNNLKIITEFTQGVISNRKMERKIERLGDAKNGSEKRTNCFLDILLDLQEQSDLTDEDIREEVETFMFEGHDTVSSSLGFMVFWLGHRPQLQEKLRVEMQEIFNTDINQDVTLDDMAKMRYAESCIRETMRLLPTVPIIGRVITEPTEIGGFAIPKGVTVMVPPFAIHRDPRYFHNPDEFDPDHFTTERVKMRNREPYAYLPFSAGPRNCIGQKFASAEQKITAAKIFRRYRVISTTHELENRGLPELVLKPSNGFWIRMERIS